MLTRRNFMGSVLGGVAACAGGGKRHQSEQAWHKRQRRSSGERRSLAAGGTRRNPSRPVRCALLGNSRLDKARPTQPNWPVGREPCGDHLEARPAAARDVRVTEM